MAHSNQFRQSILLCLDLEQDSDHLARLTAQFAAIGGQDVHILYVETRKGDLRHKEKEWLVLRQLADATVQGVEIAAMQVLEGIPEDVILRYASEHPIGVVVLGHRQNAIESIHVGSTTKAVISLSPVPVLVVPLTES
jgi:nucleotide-binding universal stress UspA family protein